MGGRMSVRLLLMQKMCESNAEEIQRVQPSRSKKGGEKVKKSKKIV